MDTGLARTFRPADGLYWLLVNGALWWLLTGGSGWAFGVVAVLGASLLSLYLKLSPWRLKLSQLPRFVLFFLGHMMAGGWDVARRALHPRMPLDPAWVVYSLREDNAQVQITLSAMVGLLPGTLASRVDGNRLQIHVLDQKSPWESTVSALEHQLIRLLGADRP